MIHRRIKVPLYGCFIHIFINENFKEVSDAYKLRYSEESCSNVACAGTLKLANFYILIRPKTKFHYIVHECIHVKNFIFIYTEMILDSNNDEAEAYLTEWIFNEILKIKNNV